jgi:hypothetical protein
MTTARDPRHTKQAGPTWSHMAKFRRPWIALSTGVVLAAGGLSVLTSSSASAASPTSSVGLRADGLLTPLPDGSVIADTAVAGGGVPTGGSALQGIAPDGTASWNVPYQDQEIILPRPVADSAGNHYWVDYLPASGYRLVASHGATEIWSIPLASDIQRLS